MFIKLKNSGKETCLSMFILMCLLAATALAQPAQLKVSAEKVLQSDSNTVALREFIKKIEKELGKIVLISEENVQVNIRTPKQIDNLDYSKLLSLLGAIEFTAFRTDDLIKIIPIQDARFSTVPVVEPSGKYYDDEYVTDFFTLNKACAPKILPIIRPMIPAHSHLAPLAEHAFVLVDTYANIQRIKKVVEKIEDSLDQPEECHYSGVSKKTKAKK